MVLITASAGNVYVAGNLVSTGLVSSTNIMTMWPVRENQGSKYLMYDPSSKEVTSVSQVSIPGGSAGQVLTTYGNNVTYWSNITSANDGLLSVTAGSHLSGGFSFSANQANNTTVTITTDATSSNTGGTIVARDANGNFSANTITMDSITLPSSIATGDLLFCDPNQKVGGTIKVVYDSDKNSIAFNGDVIFNGNTVIMHSNNLTVDDSIVQLGNSATVSSITDLGLLMAQPVGQSNVAAVYHGGTKQYVIAYTDSSVSSAQVVPTGNIAAIVYGNVTATQGFLGDGGQLSNLSSVANGSYGIPVITMQGGRITSMSNSVTTGTGSVVLSNSAVISLTNAIGLPIATGVSGLGSGVSTFLGNAFTQTGTGAVVFGTSPSLTTPNLGTPSALILTNATGLPIATGISGLGSGAATFLATPSSANFATLVTDETGTGNVVLSTNPILVTPNIGTPSAAILTNATGLPISTGVSGLATGISAFLQTASAVDLWQAVPETTGSGDLVFSNGAVFNSPVLGTPTSVTLTNATGLPISTGISGLASGAATFLATPTSANFASLVTNETGTGNVVFSNDPILVTPNLGTPSAITLTNATGLPIATGVSGLGSGVASFLATPTSANFSSMITDETGTGNVVLSTNPVLVTPNLGTPSAITLTNATGLPIATGISGLASGAATFLATPTSANFATLVTDETGTGNVVLSTNPILVTPNLGTPSTLIGTNISGTAGNLTTGNAIALNTTSSAAGTRYFPLMGTAASGNGVSPYGSIYLSFLAGGVGRGTLSTNIYQVYEQTGGNFWNVQSVSNTLTFTAPVASGSVSANLAASSGYLLSNITGLGSGVSTFLGNAFTQTGTGAVVFGTSPSLITPNLGTPASGDLTNCTGTATNVVSGASSTQTVAASATNATFYPSFYSATTGNLPALVDADLTYNPSTSTLTVPSVATNVTGGINVNVNTNNATMYPTFVTGTSGIRGIGVNSTIKINPATGVLTVPSITTSLATSNELPISTGISGLGANVATFLANPTSLNLANVVTDESGTGAIVFANSPVLVTPNLGTPSTLVGTNITGTAADFTANVSLYTNVMANTTTNQSYSIAHYSTTSGALQTFASNDFALNPRATNNPTPTGTLQTQPQVQLGRTGITNANFLMNGGTPYIHSTTSNVYGIYMSNAAAANGWTPSMIFNYGATAGGSYRDGMVYVPSGIQLGSSGNSQDPGINLYGTLDMYDTTGNGAYSHVYMNSNVVRWRMYNSGNPSADVVVFSANSMMTLYGSDASLKLYDSVTGTQSVKHGFANGNVFCQFYRGTGTTYTNVYTVSNVGNMTLAGTLNANLSPSTGYQVSNVAGMAAGVASFLTTPTSLNLANIVTDETGTGTLIFSTNPTFGSNITVTNNVNALNFVQNGNTMPAYANGTLSSNALIPIRFGANSPYNVVDIKVRLSSLSAGSSNVFLGGREASNVVTLRENSERFDIYNGITGNTFTTGLALWRAEAAGIDHMINIQLVRSPNPFSGYPPTSNGGRVQYRTDSVYTATTFGATTGRTWGNITSSAGYLSAITLHSASTFSGTWSTVHYL